MDDSLRIIDFVRGYKQISNVRRIPIALLKSKGGDIPIIGNAEIDKYKLRIRGKEYMSDDTMHKLFSSEVVVEEKVDGHPVVVLYGGYTFFCESLKDRKSVV